MTPIEIRKYKNWLEIGEWSDVKMPNPPLPEEQRWTTIALQDGRWGINFSNETDAMTFALVWGDRL